MKHLALCALLLSALHCPAPHGPQCHPHAVQTAAPVANLTASPHGAADHLTQENANVNEEDRTQPQKLSALRTQRQTGSKQAPQAQTAHRTVPGGRVRQDSIRQHPATAYEGSQDSHRTVAPAANPIPTIVGGQVVRCKGGLCWTAGSVVRLNFAASRFPMPPAQLNPDGTAFIPAPVWTLVASDQGWSDGTIALVVAVAARHPRPDVDFGALIYAVGRYEAGGDPTEVTGGHYGLQQWSRKYWRKPMADAGLDFSSERDRSEYFCRYIGAKLDAGWSLRAALGPWTETRNRALKSYFALRESK